MKDKKVLLLLILALFLSLLLVGCSLITPTPEPENELPIITSTPITAATVGFVYSYDVQATDPDGDTLTYTLSIAPSGMNIDYLTGIVSWSPSSLQLGDNEVVVRVSDGTSSVTQSFILTVSLSLISRILESIEVLPETMELSVAQSLSITSVTATYDEETAVVALTDCTYVSDPTGIVSVVDGVITGLAFGTTTITVSYTEAGVTQTDTVEVTVIPRVLESITVLPATMTLFVTQSLPITSITANYNYGTAIIALTDCTYVSDDPGIASVVNGEITGESVGTAIITVSYTEGGVTKTDTVEVTVVPANLELTPSSQTVTQGSQATIDVVVEGVTDLRGANIILNFDATKLQYASSTAGSFIPSATLLVQSIDNTNGTVTLDIAGLGLSAYASGTGTIITVVFDTIASGSTNITFGTTQLRDKDNNPISHTTSSGCSVTIN